MGATAGPSSQNPATLEAKIQKPPTLQVTNTEARVRTSIFPQGSLVEVNPLLGGF